MISDVIDVELTLSTTCLVKRLNETQILIAIFFVIIQSYIHTLLNSLLINAFQSIHPSR